MTGHLTAHAAQAHIDDMFRDAERARQAHAEQLDRLSGRWIPFKPQRARNAVAPTLATNEPCR